MSSHNTVAQGQKSHRNGPCPCGSGKKYKKCCMEKDMVTPTTPTPEPKNSFREEVKKLPEAEQLRIGQESLLSQLSLQALMHERDKEYLGGSCSLLMEQITKLQSMQYSEGIEAIVKNLEQQIRQIEAVINQSAPTWAQSIYLKTLRMVLGSTYNRNTCGPGSTPNRNPHPKHEAMGKAKVTSGALIGQGQGGQALFHQGPEVPQEELAKSEGLDPEVAKKMAAGPKFGPIKTDEDEDGDD